jgi:inosine-uridine nucleoside N-ribohydrolase
MRHIPALILALAISLPALCEKRLVLIDQDGSGPGGSNQMSMLLLLQSPQIQVLGITMVTGNAWRDEETQHTLRMLELTGHADIPVAMGAVFPLIRTQQETMLEAPLVGNVAWLGAWGGGPTNLVETKDAAGSPIIAGAKPAHSVIYQQTHGPYEVPPLPEGAPSIPSLTQLTGEDAIHFLIRQVHAHPHQVTIYACGPLTNIALAISLDPAFASLTQGIVLMGGSLNPQTTDPEFAESPRHEFNFWFDPEAAHIVLRAPWPGKSSPEDADTSRAPQPLAPSANGRDSGGSPNIGIVVTTVDVSLKARFTAAMVDQLAKSPSPAARYIAKYSEERYYMWDEIAAASLIDPTLITRERQVYMDVDIHHGPEYGNTLTWTDQLRPQTNVQKVHAQLDLDLPRFQKLFMDLMTTPATHTGKTN